MRADRVPEREERRCRAKPPAPRRCPAIAASTELPSASSPNSSPPLQKSRHLPSRDGKQLRERCREGRSAGDGRGVLREGDVPLHQRRRPTRSRRWRSRRCRSRTSRSATPSRPSTRTTSPGTMPSPARTSCIRSAPCAGHVGDAAQHRRHGVVGVVRRRVATGVRGGLLLQGAQVRQLRRGPVPSASKASGYCSSSDTTHSTDGRSAPLVERERRLRRRRRLPPMLLTTSGTAAATPANTTSSGAHREAPGEQGDRRGHHESDHGCQDRRPGQQRPRQHVADEEPGDERA